MSRSLPDIQGVGMVGHGCAAYNRIGKTKTTMPLKETHPLEKVLGVCGMGWKV